MGKQPDKKKSSVDLNIADKDIYEAMKDVPGYLDITPGHFKELYKFAYRHAMERIAGSVKAKHIMSVNVISVKYDTPLQEVAKLMADNIISGVPVVKEDRTVIGVISEKDFLARMGAKKVKTFMGVVAECLKGKGCVAVTFRAQKAEDLMTSPAVTVKEDATVSEIADIFTANNINRVPVTDDCGRLTGIVSRADIVRASAITEKTGVE